MHSVIFLKKGRCNICFGFGMHYILVFTIKLLKSTTRVVRLICRVTDRHYYVYVLFNPLNIRLSCLNKAFRKYIYSSLNLPAILPEAVLANKDRPLSYMEGRSKRL